MKKCLSIIAAVLLLLAAGSCSSFSNRGEVNNPMIGSANQTSLSVDRVLLTDSATVLDCVVHFNPGMWVRIASTSAILADGVAYQLESCDGIEADAQVTIPDSGVIRFALRFPPVPADVKSIDFSEQIADGWRMWDIDLTGEANHDKNLAELPSSLRDAALPDKFPEPVIAFADSTTVNIHLLGYKPEMGKKLYWGVNTVSGQYGTDSPVDVNADGTATVKLDIAMPSSFFVIGFSYDMGGQLNGGCLLSPGETADLYIDTHILGIRNMNERSGGDRLNCPDDYMWSFSDGYYPDFGRALRNRHAMEFYTGNYGDYNMDGDQYTAYILDDYKRLREAIESDSTISEPVRDYHLTMLDGDLIYGTVNARNILGRNYMSVNNAWGKRMPEGAVKMSLSPENVKQIASFIDFNDKNLLLYSSIGYMLGSTIWEDAGVDAGIIRLAGLYKNAYVEADRAELNDATVAELRTLSAPLADAVAAHYKARKAELDAVDMSMISRTPDVASDKLLEAIVAPHKGKVVMVDLWNTWCGPCRGALAENEPEKDGDLSSDDIVWIYIADESSPMPQYVKMIKDIRGIHYRLTSDQIAAIRKQFDVDGIPYYILVDRKGKATGRPDLRDHTLFKKTILSEL